VSIFEPEYEVGKMVSHRQCLDGTRDLESPCDASMGGLQPECGREVPNTLYETLYLRTEVPNQPTQEIVLHHRSVVKYILFMIIIYFLGGKEKNGGTWYLKCQRSL
jgi:hypothetical protein